MLLRPRVVERAFEKHVLLLNAAAGDAARDGFDPLFALQRRLGVDFDGPLGTGTQSRREQVRGLSVVVLENQQQHQTAHGSNKPSRDVA